MYKTELPSHGIPSFISELTSSPPSCLCGRSVRIIGRVEQYEASSNQAILSEPNNSSAKLRVNASFTDAENFIPGSLVMLIGELDVTESKKAKRVDTVKLKDCEDQKDKMENSLDDYGYEGERDTATDVTVILIARVAQCADRLDYSLYRQAVQVWRDLGQTQLY